MTTSATLITDERNLRALLAARTREIEWLIIDIATAEVELGTLCAETISAVRNIAAGGNAHATRFLKLAERQIAEVLGE